MCLIGGHSSHKIAQLCYTGLEGSIAIRDLNATTRDKSQRAYPGIPQIMTYGSTPYVGMAPKKMAATLKIHK